MVHLYKLLRIASASFFITMLAACSEVDSDSDTQANFSVGRSNLEWFDDTREELCGNPTPGSKRRLQAYLWYPAEPRPGSEKSSLLDQAQVAFLAALLETPSEILRKIPSNSYIDAPVANRNSTYPVLIMSHGGGGGSPQQYASTAEALASKGYIVLGLSHTHHSVATFFSNGDVITLDSSCDPLGASPELNETSSYADYTLNWNYIIKLDAFLTADIASAIKELAKLNKGQGTFSGRIDLDRIGAFGHSFGGSHVFRASRDLSSIVAAANLDGTLFSDNLETGLGPGKALMTMLSGEASGPSSQASLEAQVNLLQNSGFTTREATEVASRGRPQIAFAASRPSYLLSIPSAKHGNFSDAGLWHELGIPADQDQVNVLASRSILDLQHQMLTKFFDKFVKQKSLTLSLPATTLTGVTLESRE